jgi:hypothetical protein
LLLQTQEQPVVVCEPAHQASSTFDSLGNVLNGAVSQAQDQFGCVSCDCSYELDGLGLKVDPFRRTAFTDFDHTNPDLLRH